MKHPVNIKPFYILISVISLTGVLSSIFISFRRDMNDASIRLKSIPSEVYTSKSGDIEYLLTGKGPTILVSHGITGGIDQGIGLSNAYARNKYRFLYISRFGYLKSSMPGNASAKMQAQAYSDLLNHLRIKKVFIIGNSAGGPSAMNFAADFPNKCRGLVLISSVMPAPVPRDTSSAPPDIVFKSDFIYWLTTNIAGKSLMKMFVPPAIMVKMDKMKIKKIKHDVFMSALPISRRSEGILFDNKVSNPSIENMPFDFARINTPTLIIHAIDDPAPPYQGARKISGLIPGAILVSIKEGGHLIIGHEEEVKNAISKFISGPDR